MKKLLFIVCLMAGALFANGADAAVGSPMRSASTSFSAVRVSAACTSCGHTTVSTVVARPVHHVAVRPVHHGFHHRPMHYGFHHRPVHHGFRGHRFGHRFGFRGHRFGHRFGFRGHRFGHRFGFRGHRFACTRCGR